jgi:hypothetical protein
MKASSLNESRFQRVRVSPVRAMCGRSADVRLYRVRVTHNSEHSAAESSIKMQAIIGLISLALAAYGFTHAGVLGVLTGLIAGFGVGSGLSIVVAKNLAEASTSPRERAAQRVGGLISAIACAAGVYYGGWSLGSLFGMAGYASGIVATLLLAIALRRPDNRPTVANVQEHSQHDRAA